MHEPTVHYNSKKSYVNFTVKHSMKAHKDSKGYNSTVTLISALDDGEWLKPRSGRFTPWKDTRYP
jgi:hypothetical protein